MRELKQQLKECQVQAAREREHLTGIYEGKVATLDQALEERDHEVCVCIGGEGMYAHAYVMSFNYVRTYVNEMHVFEMNFLYLDSRHSCT